MANTQRKKNIPITSIAEIFCVINNVHTYALTLKVVVVSNEYFWPVLLSKSNWIYYARIWLIKFNSQQFASITTMFYDFNFHTLCLNICVGSPYGTHCRMRVKVPWHFIAFNLKRKTRKRRWNQPTTFTSRKIQPERKYFYILKELHRNKMILQ